MQRTALPVAAAEEEAAAAAARLALAALAVAVVVVAVVAVAAVQEQRVAQALPCRWQRRLDAAWRLAAVAAAAAAAAAVAWPWCHRLAAAGRHLGMACARLRMNVAT
jgi:hypothetical protein